ncbi:MAG: hypothetical protein A2X25_03665 [Chloroflexi bacterium GWB2_49_20]|nr:MAG: hypothetical protein A2X25_03665 [Chloroflexi bacterium GWB2_49_20]OGN76684.1 MAG: hypothetical protein A2X26_10755 [Chloroflexi bacterium GWC2_49_37]OGN83644.1 MAG: hypothetical protein A2X27_01410 [Chloroflexi bacterium GWD2_49_16]
MENNPVQESAAMPETVEPVNETTSRMPTITRYVNERDANAALQNMKTSKDGSAYVVRFTLLVRLLHLLLLVAVTGLAFTGLAQIFYANALGRIMLSLLGGLEKTQNIHHAFAILLAALAIFHILDSLESLFVRQQRPPMLLRWIDFQNFFQMQVFNLGLTRKQPRFDRYSYEEKAVYWLVTLGILVLGLTGIVQWFPIQVTEFLPGIVIPYAGIIHRWEAILVILVVFVYHLYQVLFRKPDGSIFSGKKTRADMQMEHPLELEYLEKAAAAAGSPDWPVRIELNLSDDTGEEIKETESASRDTSAPEGS